MMKWEFSTIVPPQNIYLETTHRQECLCGSPRVSRKKVQHIIGEYYENRDIEKDKSFTLSMLFLLKDGTAKCQKRALTSVSSPTGENENIMNNVNFPSNAKCCPTGPLLSHPTKNMDVTSTAEGLGETGSIATMAQNSSKASVQFSSVTQSCPTLCNPMNCIIPDLPVRHKLPESTQTHVHWVDNAIQPSHPLSSKASVLTNCFVDSIRKPAHGITRCLAFKHWNWPTGTPSPQHTPLNYPPLWDWLRVHPHGL